MYYFVLCLVLIIYCSPISVFFFLLFSFLARTACDIPRQCCLFLICPFAYGLVSFLGSAHVCQHQQIPTALLGYSLFDSEINKQMGEFMFVSMTGGFMYSFAKLKVTTRSLVCCGGGVVDFSH